MQVEIATRWLSYCGILLKNVEAVLVADISHSRILDVMRAVPGHLSQRERAMRSTCKTVVSGFYSVVLSRAFLCILNLLFEALMIFDITVHLPLRSVPPPARATSCK